MEKIIYLSGYTGNLTSKLSTHLESDHYSCIKLFLCLQKTHFFKKVGHPRPLFLYFRLFNTQFESKQMFNINKFLPMHCGPLVWKRPLYQLSHNHCPHTFTMTDKIKTTLGGVVSKAVASNSRRPGFESSHRQFLLGTIHF